MLSSSLVLLGGELVQIAHEIARDRTGSPEDSAEAQGTGVQGVQGTGVQGAPAAVSGVQMWRMRAVGELDSDLASERAAGAVAGRGDEGPEHDTEAFMYSGSQL